MGGSIIATLVIHLWALWSSLVLCFNSLCPGSFSCALCSAGLCGTLLFWLPMACFPHIQTRVYLLLLLNVYLFFDCHVFIVWPHNVSLIFNWASCNALRVLRGNIFLSIWSEYIFLSRLAKTTRITRIAFFARASHTYILPPLPIGGLGGFLGYIKVFIAIYHFCTFADAGSPASRGAKAARTAHSLQIRRISSHPTVR